MIAVISASSAAPAALPADPDRRMRLLHGLWVVGRVLEPVVAALERHVVLCEQETQNLDALLETIHPLGDRRERYAELAMLRLVPRGTDRALDAAAGEVIDGDDLRGQHGGMSMRHAGDERAEPYARGRRASPASSVHASSDGPLGSA